LKGAAADVASKILKHTQMHLQRSFLLNMEVENYHLRCFRPPHVGMRELTLGRKH
jgi:hypothetical protein